MQVAPLERKSNTGQAKYDDYYASDRLEEWRRLGAKNKADNVVSMCHDVPHASILEIGCGSGAVLERLSELGFGSILYGLEISASGIESLRAQHIPSLSEAELFDGESIPYLDRHFDLAILSHVVEHLEYPRRLLYEAGRVASHVFVEVPLEHTVRLTRDYDYNEVGHINFYTATTIRRLVQTCGLRVRRQILTDTSREMLQFQFGRAGILRHAIRRTALTVAPKLARQVFVYHSAILAESPHRSA